jgi:septum formation protein
VAEDTPTQPRVTLFLASRSPRRRSLLDEAGIAHRTVESGVDDGTLRAATSRVPAWVASLAYLKAAAGWAALPAQERPRAVVLGADTTVLFQGQVLGKPRDERDARRMLGALLGSVHQVLTGVALVGAGAGPRVRREMFADAATVVFGGASPAVLEGYIASGAWRGKAGGYNLPELSGRWWDARCEGDPTTVEGLPMRRLVPALAEVGIGSIGTAGAHPGGAR